MQFLRTVFWIVLAVLAVIFSLNNWTPVRVNLWSGIVVDTWLPALLIITFLIGLLPVLVLHRATRWSLRRKLDTANRALTETRIAAETAQIDAVAAIPDSQLPSGRPL